VLLLGQDEYPPDTEVVNFFKLDQIFLGYTYTFIIEGAKIQLFNTKYEYHLFNNPKYFGLIQLINISFTVSLL